MALIRWEPFRELENMQRQMNRMFDHMISPERREPMGEGMTFVPAVEIQEMDNEVHLRIESPGIAPEDLDVRVSEEAVSVSGERKFETNVEEKGMRRSEFRYGRFQRVIPLPAQVQNDKVQAEFKHGILSLTLPKAEIERNRVVKVNLAEQQQQGQVSFGQAQPNQTSQNPQEHNHQSQVKVG